MSPAPHIRRPSADSLREIAERRRIAAEAFSEDAKEHERMAKKFAAEGKTRNAEQQHCLAVVKARSRDEALKAADSYEARADELDGKTNQKEMAG